MRGHLHRGTVSIAIDLNDVFSDITDAELKAECVARGLMPKAESPQTKVKSVSLDGEELSEIDALVRYGDFEGAMLHLERMLPRHLRVFSPRLARGAMQ